MQLLMFEIKKLLFNKRTLIILLVVLAMSIVSGVLDGYYWNNQVGDINLYNKMVEKYEGKIDWNLKEECYDLKKEDSKSNMSQEDKRLSTLKKYYSQAIDSAEMWSDKDQDKTRYKYTIGYLEKMCSELENEGQKDSYLYLDTFKNLNMLKTNTQPEFHNNEGWQNIYSYVLSRKGAFLIQIVLLVLIAPIFSDESVNNMDVIIRATKKGRNEIIRAKIITGLIFGIVWVTLFYIINVSLRIIMYKNSFFPSESLNNIRGYEFTPFNLSVLQGFELSYLATILSVCTIVVLFCLVSATQKNSIVSIALGAVIIVIPFFAEGDNIFSKIIMLLPTATIDSSNLFSQYSSYNIINRPTVYPIVALTSLVCITFGGIFLTYKIFSGTLYKYRRY